MKQKKVRIFMVCKFIGDIGDKIQTVNRKSNKNGQRCIQLHFRYILYNADIVN